MVSVTRYLLPLFYVTEWLAEGARGGEEELEGLTRALLAFLLLFLGFGFV